MVELEVYRCRIGTFRCKLTSSKCQDVQVSCHVSREQISRVKTMFVVGTMALCLVLLGCQLKEQEAVRWPSSPGTTCHKILCFVRSVWELKGNMSYNARTVRDNFQWFSSILNKEQNYQTHADNTSYISHPVDVIFLVERHGTCSYLLGNAGQHAYNGNPPKNSNTSSPDTDEQIKKLHCKMVKCLYHQLHPDLKSEWETVIVMLRMYLTPVEIARIHNIDDVCEKLLTMQKIQYGHYDNLKELFPDHQICCNIVDKCSREIEELQHHHTQQDPRVGMMHTVNIGPNRHTSRSSATAQAGGANGATTVTNTSGTQTTSSASTSATQTTNTATNSSGTQTGAGPRTSAFIMPGLPRGIPGLGQGIPGLGQGIPGQGQGIPGLGAGILGLRARNPGAMDPFLQCCSRHFLQSRERMTRNQSQSRSSSAPNNQGGRNATGAPSSASSTTGGATTTTSTSGTSSNSNTPISRPATSSTTTTSSAATSSTTTSTAGTPPMFNPYAGKSKEPTDGMALYVEKWKQQDLLCYETKGVKAVKEKICNDSYVCVIGVPGSGKSTAIRHAALHLQKTSQYTIYPLQTPEEFDKYLDKDKKQVFVKDDTVGEYSVDKEMLGLWDKHNDRIKSCLEVSKNTKFLTSLRLQLYLDETLKGKTYIFNDPGKKVSFSDEDFKLSLDDMKNMLRHYLEVRNVGNSEALIKDICGKGWWRWGWDDGGWAARSADYFPLLCKVFSENESVRENPKKFFTAPFPALTDIFRQIKSKNKHQFCGLLLCAFMELKNDYFKSEYPHDKPKIFTSLIESQKLDPEQDLDDIENALHALDGVYISHVANKYHFSHSTFRDITTFLYNNKYVIFQHARLYFINSRVRLFSKLSEDDDYVLVFHGEDCIELLVNRMIHELKCWPGRWRGAGFIVGNRYIDDERVVNALCTKLFDSQDTDITQDMVDWLFERCMRAVWEYSRRHRDNRDEMSLPCYKLLVGLIPRVDCTRRIDVGYPVFLCVRTGSLSLTKLVVQQNSAVINTVDRYNSSVLHEALRCGNNVDMTRYLLSLPNLTCLNHRDREHGSPYWYVVRGRDWFGRQIANRQEMMDIYKQAGAIALGVSSGDHISMMISIIVMMMKMMI